MWQTTKLAAILIGATIGGNKHCGQQQQVAVAGQVLVPATVNGYQNYLVSVPQAVAFSNIAVQVGVPVTTYSPLQYQAMPQGYGLSMPQHVQQQQQHVECQCPKCKETRVQALSEEDQLNERVATIFRTSCVSCHNTDKHKGNLRLFDDEGRMYPLPRLTILAKVKDANPETRMPKGTDALTEEQIADLEAWAVPNEESLW